MKSGMRGQYGYNASPQWNQGIFRLINSCQNALVRTSMSESPAEPDGTRDLSGLHWGQPALVQRPNIEGETQWVKPVRCYGRFGSGFVKVYVVETKG